MLCPRVSDIYGHASDKAGIFALSEFLNDLTTTKGIWWSQIFKNNQFISQHTADFIDCLSTGVEIEAETYPFFQINQGKETTNFGEMKFDSPAFSAFCVFREPGFPALPADFREKYIMPFLKTATGVGGWIDPVSKTVDLTSLPAIEITGAWMPNVPLEGTSVAGDPMSHQLPAIASKNKQALIESDFQPI